MKNWGIQNRVLFIALVPALLLTTALVAFFAMNRLSEIEAELDARGQAIARQLSPACEYGVFSGNTTILYHLANEALNEADVSYVLISDVYGKQLAEAYKNDAGATNQKDIKTFKAMIRNHEVNIDDFHGSAAPNETTLGWVEVGISTQRSLAEKQSEVIYQSIAITITGYVFILLLALRIARSVTSPMLELTAAIEKIKKGDLSIQLNLDAGGEFAVVEKGINTMTKALKEAHEKELSTTRQELYVAKTQALTTLQCLAEGVITTDESGHVQYLNTAAEQLLGWKNKDVLGLTIQDVLKIANQDEQTDVESMINRCLNEGLIIRGDGHFTIVPKHNRRIAVRYSVAPIRSQDENMLGAVVVLHDVSEMLVLSERLTYQATHDALTGLLNRHEFERRLKVNLEKTKRGKRESALCYLDLDQFKIVNDTCGHTAGDEFLKQLAAKLQPLIRGRDILARLGGDEFGIILEECFMEQAIKILNNVKRNISSFRFYWEGHTFDVGVSIGVVTIDSNTESISEVLRAADSACYVAKENGRNRIHVYHKNDESLLKHQGEMQWAGRIKRALQEDHFQLYAQAIRPLSNTGIAKRHYYEITVKLKEAQNLIDPDVFLPAAERYNLMPMLDCWVVKNTLEIIAGYFKTIGTKKIKNTCFAINLSGQSLTEKDFHKFILGECHRLKVPASTICFEITETAAIANLLNATKFIKTMRDQGCHFALDDFGSGLSSFSYLKHLDVDHLKIDGSFVRDIANDDISFSMVQSINQIGHVMGLETIAEFVENDAIKTRLQEINVDYGQGYGLDRPKPFQQRFNNEVSALN